MNVTVSTGIEELKRQFSSASFKIREDSQGGAYVVMEPVPIGSKYRPETTWIGFQIPAQYPYADIYPVFMGSDVTRADGADIKEPLTRNHRFEDRTAIQISQRNSTAQNGLQKATTKILKVLHFLEKLP